MHCSAGEGACVVAGVGGWVAFVVVALLVVGLVVGEFAVVSTLAVDAAKQMPIVIRNVQPINNVNFIVFAVLYSPENKCQMRMYDEF